MILLSFLPIVGYAYKYSEKRPPFNYPGNFFAFGFSDRLAHANKELTKIDYYNISDKGNDTFFFNKRIKSSQHLINFIISGALSNKYIGTKFDFGFVPFGNRNYHQNISVFIPIPISENICIAPFFGYSRLKKQIKIGSMSGKNETLIFEKSEFEKLYIKAQEVFHSYYYGLGGFITIEENISLFFDTKIHSTFHTRKEIKVLGYSNNEDYLNSPNRVHIYQEYNKEVYIRNEQNQKIPHFFNLKQLAFSVQIVFTIESNTGSGYSPKKFMGTQ